MKKILNNKLGLTIIVLFTALSILFENNAHAIKESNTSEQIIQKALKNLNSEQVINLNTTPHFDFEDLDISEEPKEIYSNLDGLGRVTLANAMISKETMPTEKRKSISKITPTGWIQHQTNGQALYNRSHLIAHSLTAENTTKENLMTGTRYFNQILMTKYENQILKYIKNTNNHVRYRVTPIFIENNLVANGIILEALSVEDKGKGIKINVFIPNIQPRIKINYKNGKIIQK